MSSSNEPPSATGVGVGCLVLVFFMVIGGLLAWSLFGYDPRTAVGVGFVSGFLAYLGIVFTPCVFAGIWLVIVAIVLCVLIAVKAASHS